jgi:glucosylceramidase
MKSTASDVGESVRLASRSRREFLHSALGLAAASFARPFFPSAEAIAIEGSNTSPDEIRCWVTSRNLRFAPVNSAHWEGSSSPTESAIVLNPDKRFQEILGFGAAFTDAACFTFHRLSPVERESLFHELFHPSEMGLNVCRSTIGASDYSRDVYSYDEGSPDPRLKRFTIDHDRSYILPILREARNANPDLFLFSSPWSPPGWMKSGGSMLGGSMRHRYLADYAQYFLKFLRGYSADGVPVQAITIQNEVDTDQDARMPACIWPQEYEIEFVRDHLGPLLEQNGISTKIWILDHNFNLWGRVLDELGDAGVRRYSNAVAWHGYVGSADMASKVHEAYPDAAMFWTEGGPDINQPDYATGWAEWGVSFTASLRNWCRSITGWNLALDEHGKPNLGPFSCGGLLTIHSKTREIARSGQYWAFAHFSRVVKQGARRIDSTGTISEISHVAFENTDGKRVLVVTNRGADRQVTVEMGSSSAKMSLPENSMTTWQWA